MKPILFNTEMVQAILCGDKTQTRRIIKLPEGMSGKPVCNPLGFMYPCGIKRPPYKVGDILYVRETWKIQSMSNYDKRIKILFKAEPNEKLKEVYVSSERYDDLMKYECKNGWQPSLFMPKEAARLFLKVTNIRAQRIQDITNEEVLKEGMKSYTKDNKIFKYAPSDEWWEDYCVKHRKQFKGTPWQEMPQEPQQAFKYLWNSCYDYPKSWVCNPWVWVIEFKKVDGPLEKILGSDLNDI